jgi:transposase InsO family protein
MDFVHDTLVDGRRFRILAVVDDYTRENLCLVADTSLPGDRVIRELEAVIARRGLPRQCVSDNGLTSGPKPLRWGNAAAFTQIYLEHNAAIGYGQRTAQNGPGRASRTTATTAMASKAVSAARRMNRKPKPKAQ